MKKLILLFLVFTCVVFGQSTKYLHVSTIPGNADIFVGSSIPDYGNAPDYASPAFIPVDGEDHILLALFKPEFTDTLLDVNLSAKDTSYIIVSLKQSYDNDLIEEQQDFVARRSRRSAGNILKWSSIAPFVASAISASITLYQISKAEDAKKILENSKIANGEKYLQAKEDFESHRSSARTAKKVTIGTFAGGAVLIAAGFILSF
ncbi:MAG: hypothetical protein MJY87_07000 [Fibrobacter sp.]|nr:hypothetical protein [Fibrobacter sp.]